MVLPPIFLLFHLLFTTSSLTFYPNAPWLYPFQSTKPSQTSSLWWHGDILKYF